MFSCKTKGSCWEGVQIILPQQLLIRNSDSDHTVNWKPCFSCHSSRQDKSDLCWHRAEAINRAIKFQYTDFTTAHSEIYCRTRKSELKKTIHQYEWRSNWFFSCIIIFRVQHSMNNLVWRCIFSFYFYICEILRETFFQTYLSAYALNPLARRSVVSQP